MERSRKAFFHLLCSNVGLLCTFVVLWKNCQHHSETVQKRRRSERTFDWRRCEKRSRESGNREISLNFLQRSGEVDVVQAIDLTKEYDTLTAVDHLSFGIGQNECFGLLGPNGENNSLWMKGAGKSTTIEMLTRETVPSSGDIRFNGKSALQNPKVYEWIWFDWRQVRSD